MGRFVPGILNNAHRTENVLFRQRHRSDGGDVLRHVFESLRMTERSSLLFPHADDAHLAEAALVLASKPGVRLDPIDDNNGVCRIGVSIEIRGPAVGGYVKLHQILI